MIADRAYSPGSLPFIDRRASPRQSLLLGFCTAVLM
jgi:hypothetical protein